MTTKGSCACGAIAYQFEGEALTKALCHCIDCQKRRCIPAYIWATTMLTRAPAKFQWTGGAFTSNAVVPRTAFSVTKGTPRAWDAVGASGKINKHFFCGDCGSSLYTELEVLPDVTCVKAGGLDGGAASLDGVINVEYYTKDRVSYLGEALNAEQKTHFG
ncbi:hypothetical protein BN1723_002676 [Verticillium longisporum]|uniref:CENP-V/GFA domain-containing protein n=1 Tax=Verticillium longisporum TaxID=100787 RepID=A0A0G4LFI2_VERLO|nr:hypothetical protein BN1723_002676 [Verticillium longisporum]